LRAEARPCRRALDGSRFHRAAQISSREEKRGVREMLNLALGFVSSFLVVLCIVRTTRMHGAVSLDVDLRGIQKHHAYAVPRIGGLALMCGITLTSALTPLWSESPFAESMLLLLCAVPVVAGGLAEDITKRISPCARLLCALASALAACLILNAVITRVDLPLVDPWLRILPVGIAITMLAAAGLTNAVNIIDGFNGLASVVAILVFASIGHVAHELNDRFVMTIALTMIGSIGGFVVWNFPAPSIFLGDGGAYLAGFMMAELLVLLIARHPDISAWYAVAVAIYPAFETLFSIYRRLARGRSAGQPDALHLHSLVYRRVVRKARDSSDLRRCARCNSRTSVYLWLLSLIGVVPATFFWDMPIVLASATFAFACVYVWLYLAIVRFRTPRWLRVVSNATDIPASHAGQPRP
jgi:UDP-N-acetylmuramyl pentapeptide phosphotransferase/UDP-N-acetylglucosamine-1-phosphate transferase